MKRRANEVAIILAMKLAGLLCGGSSTQNAPTTAPVSPPPLSGALGTPVQLFNGKDLHGWVWYQRPPRTATAPAAVAIEQVWSVADGVLHTRGKPTGYIR